MVGSQRAPEEGSRSFVQITRFSDARPFFPLDSKTEEVRRVPEQGLVVVAIGVNVEDVTGRNYGEILEAVLPSVYKPDIGQVLSWEGL